MLFRAYSLTKGPTMHKAFLQLLLFFTTIVVHGMEHNQQIASFNDIDCHAVYNSLRDDYRAYTQQCLEKYKKSSFTPHDMENIKNKSDTYTGHSTVTPLFKACDEHNNHFPHIAIQKYDLPVLTWLMMHKYPSYPINNDGKGFIELCIDHLSPNNSIDDKKKEIAHEMLNLLTTTYAHCLSLALRKPIVQRLLTLQLEHQQQFNNSLYSNFFITALTDVCISRFLTEGIDNINHLDILSLYQQATDPKTGNTFTHNALIRADADGLYDLIKKNYISSIKNKAGLSPCELALKIYEQFIRPTIITTDKTSTRFYEYCCCITMLLNDQKKKNNNGTIMQCCDKHVI
jgi:hypothetical protein